MYPFMRMAKEIFVNRNAPPLELTQTHVSYHVCWPWDLDFWLELNNGRTLTFYDLGRIPLARRTGLIRALRENGWGLTVAGSSVRYRRRVRVFQKVQMRSRVVGWGARFIYIEQSMWHCGKCTSQALLRTAVTDRNGIVPCEKLLTALGAEPDRQQPLPAWVQNWIDAEATRPWPPAA